MVTNYGCKIPVLKVVGLNPTGVTRDGKVPERCFPIDF